MKAAGVAIAIMAIVALSMLGCARRPKAPEIGGTETIESSENARAYHADHASTFRAALDALRRIDSASDKFVKHDEGLIIFKRPGDRGEIRARVRKIDARTTRVELSAKTRGKRGRDVDDKETRALFFSELDQLLGDVPRAGEADAADESAAEAPVEESLGDEAPGDDPIIKSLKKELQLDEEAGFLEKLAPDELALLERRLRSLASASAEKEAMARRCAACYIDLARFHHDDGEYSRAADALKIAVSVDPDNAVAHCNLGEIYRHLGLYEQAVGELKEAERLDPEFGDTYINLGIIYDDYLPDDRKALEYYRKYLELGGSDKRVPQWIAELEEGP